MAIGNEVSEKIVLMLLPTTTTTIVVMVMTKRRSSQSRKHCGIGVFQRGIASTLQRLQPRRCFIGRRVQVPARCGKAAALRSLKNVNNLLLNVRWLCWVITTGRGCYELTMPLVEFFVWRRLVLIIDTGATVLWPAFWLLHATGCKALRLPWSVLQTDLFSKFDVWKSLKFIDRLRSPLKCKPLCCKAWMASRHFLFFFDLLLLSAVRSQIFFVSFCQSIKPSKICK